MSCGYVAVNSALRSISGLVVEYIVAIDVTRVRFPADAYMLMAHDVIANGA